MAKEVLRCNGRRCGKHEALRLKLREYQDAQIPVTKPSKQLKRSKK